MTCILQVAGCRLVAGMLLVGCCKETDWAHLVSEVPVMIDLVNHKRPAVCFLVTTYLLRAPCLTLEINLDVMR